LPQSCNKSSDDRDVITADCWHQQWHLGNETDLRYNVSWRHGTNCMTTTRTALIGLLKWVHLTPDINRQLYIRFHRRTTRDECIWKVVVRHLNQQQTTQLYKVVA